MVIMTAVAEIFAFVTLQHAQQLLIWFVLLVGSTPSKTHRHVVHKKLKNVLSKDVGKFNR